MKGSQLLYAALLALCAASCKEKAKTYDASGSFEAVETIISAEAGGQLLQLKIEEGQQLDSGQVVGYIDSTQLHLNMQRLAQNKRAVLSGRPQTSVQLESLEKELDNAELDQDRIANLVKGGVASQKQLDDANAKIVTLHARIHAQRSTLDISTASLNEQGSTIDVQKKEINDQLRKTIIVNPVRGTVLTKYAQQFEMATVGKPLYKIADLSTIVLRAYITGDQVQQVKIGQQVKVETDDGKGGFKPAQGTITWINDKAEFTPKTIQTKSERANLVYAVKVNVRNDGYLKIGMYGQVSWNQY